MAVTLEANLADPNSLAFYLASRFGNLNLVTKSQLGFFSSFFLKKLHVAFTKTASVNKGNSSVLVADKLSYSSKNVLAKKYRNVK